MRAQRLVCVCEREREREQIPIMSLVDVFFFFVDKSEKCDSFSNSSFLLKKLQTSLFSKLHQTNPNK